MKIVFENNKWKPINELCFIYCWTNLVNDKKYIGQTKNGKQRLYDEIGGYNCNILLKRAIEKYGRENFQCEILEECAQNELNEKEKFWIQEKHSLKSEWGYNLTTGGDSNMQFIIKRFGQYTYEGKLINIFDSTYAASIQFHQYQNISTIQGHIKDSLEKKRLTAYGFIWKFLDEEFEFVFQSSWKAVGQYNYNGELLKVYPNIKQAAEQNNIHYKNLYSCITRECCKQCKGFIWEYVDLNNPELTTLPYIYRIPTRIEEYDLEGNLLNIFPSIRSAAEQTNDSRTRISLCCNGHQASTHGHIWKKISTAEV